MGKPKTDRIKRIGLVLEMEDGRRIMVYSEPQDAEVTIDTKRPEPVPWDHPAWRSVRETPIRASILISGLESYSLVFQEPGQSADKQLEQIAREVEQ